MSEIHPPEDCKTMADVRGGVDALDRALVALLGRRMRYMDAAARIKDTRETVRDEGRKAQVIANVCVHAVPAGVPQALVADIWEVLVEGSIAYELERFDAR